MNSEDEKFCQESLEIARAETLKHCKAVKLTPRRVLKGIAEGLDAKENKVFYDRQTEKVVYSKKLINWTARQKAIDQAVSILDLTPVEKKKIEFPDED
jgi:isopenicillin N synthase-like dioxygenase